MRTDMLRDAPCHPDVLVRFAELTFRDLVCQPESRLVLQRLMRGGVVACRQLHNRCPHLFSAVDLELQEALELLAVVQNGLVSARSMGSGVDVAHLSQLVQRALRTFDRHIDRLDLIEVSERLRSVGAYRGLIGICTRVARARDPRDECLRPQDPTNARTQQLHYARLECYQVVLEVFEELLALMRQSQSMGGATSTTILGIGNGVLGQPGGRLPPGVQPQSQQHRRSPDVPELLPVPVPARDAAPTLEAFLLHCLEGQPYLADELFHHCVLKWMLQRGLPMYCYDSPYLRGFLETYASDQPELLCRYFQQRGRWGEACDAYMALARGSGGRMTLSLEDRLVLIQSALNCAQMPGSNRRVEPIRQVASELAAGSGVTDPRRVAARGNAGVG